MISQIYKLKVEKGKLLKLSVLNHHYTVSISVESDWWLEMLGLSFPLNISIVFD